MFINRKDLTILEEKIINHFDGIIRELKNEIELLKTSPKSGQKTKKVVD